MIAAIRLVTITLAITAASTAMAQQDDHGNNRDTATRIQYDIAQPGTIHASFDVDYFRVDLQGRARVQFRSTMDLDTIGTLYDSEGNFITSVDDIGPGDFNFLITEELDRGVYYLKVEGFGNADIGDYQVLTRFNLSGDDHGNTYGSSTIVPLGPRIAGSVNNSSDDDWFRVDFPVRTYAEVITTSQNPISTDLYFPDQGSVRPHPDNGGTTTRHRWFGDWHGTFYFRVSGSVSAYNVRVEADDIGCGVAVSPLLPGEIVEAKRAAGISSEAMTN
ncbi:MAG: hypothetical protein OXC69_04855 [Candidatus Tectomicrobia bacterium]|nr:hypothetical protein [Candidatus Tectomicrobia bacterium]